MDSLYKIVGIALVTVIATLIVRPVRPDFAVFISVVGGVIILFLLAGYIADIFDIFSKIFTFTNVNASLYKIILKIIGVGYLVEFTASLCADTGNGSLGDKVLLGGKIVILVMALPIITSILEIVMELLPV